MDKRQKVAIATLCLLCGIALTTSAPTLLTPWWILPRRIFLIFADCAPSLFQINHLTIICWNLRWWIFILLFYFAINMTNGRPSFPIKNAKKNLQTTQFCRTDRWIPFTTFDSLYSMFGSGLDWWVQVQPHVCWKWGLKDLTHIAKHFKTLKNIAKHCKTLQNFAKHCKTLQNIAKHCKTLQNIAKHCKTLQNIAKLCKTLQNQGASSKKHVFYLKAQLGLLFIIEKTGQS